MERTVRFNIAPVKGRPGAVRWDETDPVSGAPRAEGDHYDQLHDRDGLWLLNGYVLGRDECRWSPRSALLPRAVIAGGEIETSSTCTVPINGKPTSLALRTKLEFLRTYDFVVAGRAHPAIDVARTRVLTDNDSGTTITSDAVDTYAFDIRVRVRTEDHSTTRRADGASQETTRVLVLTSSP